MKKIFLTGIGGVGMSSLALYLLGAGFQVNGSDVADFRLRKLLESKGIAVYLSHHEDNIMGSDLLIYSTAVPKNNPEIAKAIELGIPQINRIQALQQFLNKQQIIAITGSYGKSTTTTFTASLMNQAGLSPSWLIGADLFSFPPAKYNKSRWTVLETDESRPEFLDFTPYSVIITNVGKDHLTNYNNSQENLTRELLDFLSKKNNQTKAVLCGDDIASIALIKPFQQKSEVLLCGLGKNNDYQITNIHTSFLTNSFQTSFTLKCPDGISFECQIPMPGEKNVIDATLALAMTLQVGGNRDVCIDGLSKLPCMDRRFKIVHYSDHSIVVDDEGDSPEVIRTVLQNAKDWFPQKKLIAVLQPHRYSRLQNLFTEYVSVMSSFPDEIILLPVYSAGEEEIVEVNSQKLMDSILSRGFSEKNAQLLSMKDTITCLRSKLDKNYLIITLGPGDIWKVAEKLAKSKSI
jgi:UDP-N-acetylmuramate--alanine ligase